MPVLVFISDVNEVSEKGSKYSMILRRRLIKEGHMRHFWLSFLAAGAALGYAAYLLAQEGKEKVNVTGVYQ